MENEYMIKEMLAKEKKKKGVRKLNTARHRIYGPIKKSGKAIHIIGNTATFPSVFITNLFFASPTLTTFFIYF